MEQQQAKLLESLENKRKFKQQITQQLSHRCGHDRNYVSDKHGKFNIFIFILSTLQQNV